MEIQKAREKHGGWEKKFFKKKKKEEEEEKKYMRENIAKIISIIIIWFI